MQGYEPSYRSDYSPWDPGPDTSGRGGGVPIKRSRPWLIAIVAGVTMLVLIAAVCNQKVTEVIEKHLVTQSDQTGPTFADSVLRMLTVYAWRFTSRAQDTANQYPASFVFIGTTVVVILLLVAVLARGRGGFGQLLVAVWVSVVVATMLAAYVRALVLDAHALDADSGGKATTVFFSVLSPGAYTCAASIAFGFVVALVAAIVGTSTRHTDMVGATADNAAAPYHQPPAGDQPSTAYPPPAAYQPPPPGGQPWATPVPGPISTPTSAPPEREQHTAVLPAVDRPRTDSERGPDVPGDGTDHDSGTTADLPRRRPEN